VLILSEGVFAEKALAAREILLSSKITSEVMDVRSLKPLPAAQILKSLKGKKLIVTLENHGLVGGLGDLTARLLRENDVVIKHRALGFPDEVVHHGSIADIEKLYKLSPPDIAATVKRALKKR